MKENGAVAVLDQFPFHFDDERYVSSVGGTYCVPLHTSTLRCFSKKERISLLRDREESLQASLLDARHAFANDVLERWVCRTYIARPEGGSEPSLEDAGDTRLLWYIIEENTELQSRLEDFRELKEGPVNRDNLLQRLSGYIRGNYDSLVNEVLDTLAEKNRLTV